MIKKLVDIFIEHQDELEFTETVFNYGDLIVKILTLFNKYGEKFNIEKIREIDDGEYQGTLLYIFHIDEYQPNKYYSTMIDYGSCSGCDTLENINGFESDLNDSQIKDYKTLCLHIVQGIKKL